MDTSYLKKKLHISCPLVFRTVCKTETNTVNVHIKRTEILPLVNVAVKSVKSILLLFLSICNSNKCF